MKQNHNILSLLSKCMLVCSLLWIQSCSDDGDVPQNIDSQITFSNITPAMTVWGNVPISLEVSDDMGIASVEIFVDGVSVATLSGAPFTVTWNATEVNDGAHTIKAIVIDKQGNKTEKETTVTVKNALLTIDIAANHLNDDERGYVFLSDENGKLIVFSEYKNNDDVVLKSPTFTGTKFFLTEVLVINFSGVQNVRMWTFYEVERGQAWKVHNDGSVEEAVDAGDANLTLTNAAANSGYDIYSNTEDRTSVDGSTTTASLPLGTAPSKLYVTRYSTQDGKTVQYGLFPNVIVGNNTLNLSQVNQPMTKVTATMPEEYNYASVRMLAYPTLNDYTNGYKLQAFSNRPGDSGTTSFDIYYPGAAFTTYYSIIEMDADDRTYYAGSTTDLFKVNELSHKISFGFADNKLTYSATGDFSFISTGFQTEHSFWSLILPEGSAKVVPPLTVPDQLKDFEIPAFGSPDLYVIYQFGGVDDYNDLKKFISTSSRNMFELYDDGKNFTEISYWNISSANGRSKTSHKRHSFGPAARN